MAAGLDWVDVPSNEILGFAAEVYVVGEHEVLWPVDDLLVRVVCRL